jgi:hypothetical protein
MRGAVVAVVGIVGILIGAGAGYLVGYAGERTVTSVSTTTLVTTVTFTSTYVYDSGALLQLQVTLNASTIQSGGAVGAVISVFNPLATNVTVGVPATENAFFHSWDSMDFVCGGNALSYTASFALFRGHVNSDNLSSAGAPLTLAPPFYPPCAPPFSPSSVIFKPQSSEAWAYFPQGSATPVLVSVNATTGVEICQPSGDGTTTCSGGATGLYGYWDLSAPGSCTSSTTSSNCFHYFPPGWYTLVVEAVWGQSAFESFQVT